MVKNAVAPVIIITGATFIFIDYVQAGTFYIFGTTIIQRYFLNLHSIYQSAFSSAFFNSSRFGIDTIL